MDASASNGDFARKIPFDKLPLYLKDKRFGACTLIIQSLDSCNEPQRWSSILNLLSLGVEIVTVSTLLHLQSNKYNSSRTGQLRNSLLVDSSSGNSTRARYKVFRLAKDTICGSKRAHSISIFNTVNEGQQKTH
uniref:Uncharacterized protein n=1 Tax=Opuntia streptacantha TaxID=393608 RepID=A0A7C9B1H8_OPUST